jgi:hypothetical protein
VREVDADAVQDDPARQPIYQAGVVAGSAAVAFDGEKQFLIADPLTNALREASGLTITFVARTMHDRAQFVLAIQEEDANVDVARIGFTKPDAVRVKVSERGGRDYLDSGSQLLYGFAIYTLVIDRNLVSVFMDGKAILEKPAVTPAFSAARRVSIGQEWDDAGAPSDFFAGQLAELVVYGRALDPDERRSLEAYLAKKYALTY